MIGSGEFKIQIGEGEEAQEIGFLFGMLGSAYTEAKAGKTIFQVFQEIATAHGTLAKIQYFWGAALAYNEAKGINKKITMADVANYLEKMGEAKEYEIYLKSVETYLPKNWNAPKEAGLQQADVLQTSTTSGS